MTFKVGDIVTWRSGRSKSKETLPMAVAGCRIMAFGTAENGEPAATLQIPGFNLPDEECNAYLSDLEPQN